MATRIVAVMATHDRARQQIAVETITLLHKQTLPPLHIIVVGDSDSEWKVARRTNSEFIKVPNRPLGRKWQIGISMAKYFDPQAVLIIGSDTWLSYTWVATCMKAIKEGYDLVGKNMWYVCAAKPGVKVEISQRAYLKKGARDQPVGGGRLFSRNILDALDWDLFKLDQENGLDTVSHRRVVAKRGRIKILNTDPKIKVMGIKSTWECMGTYDQVVNSPKLKILPGVHPLHTKSWINSNFPEGSEALERAIPGVRFT